MLDNIINRLKRSASTSHSQNNLRNGAVTSAVRRISQEIRRKIMSKPNREFIFSKNWRLNGIGDDLDCAEQIMSLGATVKTMSGPVRGPIYFECPEKKRFGCKIVIRASVLPQGNNQLKWHIKGRHRNREKHRLLQKNQNARITPRFKKKIEDRIRALRDVLVFHLTKQNTAKSNESTETIRNYVFASTTITSNGITHPKLPSYQETNSNSN